MLEAGTLVFGFSLWDERSQCETLSAQAIDPLRDTPQPHLQLQRVRVYRISYGWLEAEVTSKPAIRAFRVAHIELAACAIRQP